MSYINQLILVNFVKNLGGKQIWCHQIFNFITSNADVAGTYKLQGL